ncbi:hypothetical protein [Sansalvadorimonas verongulae]|uniref:hypothetical protein n=1 Tax=Sansalvadorimonas verongulae TaxID=2172824 RepID=UPI0012BD0FC2|nr:hypothetical protein [Sansalvadorimonas verongulae]MTI11924.1 hypothetical protein [Sansalvadorimonas verongulae]
METLTAKQKANRAYYARNEEKIKAQKKAAATSKRVEKQTNKRPLVVKTRPAVKAPRKVTARSEEVQRMKVRKRIDDYHLARELGIGVEEL